MQFDGVVVTDALGMGGFNGWYKTPLEAQIESFKAGCDMMLWPCPEYVDAMVNAVENGYVSIERVDDAVSRILTMKEKLGLFKKENYAVKLNDEEKEFVKKVQQETAENSITLIKDNVGFFPLCPEKTKKIAIIPITHHIPAFEEAELLCDELRQKGFEVKYCKDGISNGEIDENDLIIYALFSRPFRPMGFLDFHSDEARKISESLMYGTEKSIVVSFGSPYFGNQYFERAEAYINAYSMLSPSVKAFVRAAVGEIKFGSFSPVELG